MPVLQIQLLGDVRLSYDEAPLAGFHTPRLQVLLAWLVLHAGLPQPRARLAYLFWPDSNEEQAHTNLRKALYDLRRALPDPEQFLCLERATAQWRREAPYWLDVAAFESALYADAEAHQAAESIAHAVALYGGDLLPGCYDEWVLPERDRLRDAFTALLEAGIARHEAAREYPTALVYAQRLVRHEPLHEVAYRTLMRLHALTGNRVAALRAYHDCAAVLQRDLEVAPSTATRELYERLLNLETAAASAPAATLALVGRAREWGELQRAWHSAAGGAARVALVMGDAGIGKTRLLEELRNWAARQGLTTAVARCYGAEGTLAYALVTALLRGLRLPSLEPVWRAEIARLLPEALAGHPDLPRPGPLTEPWQRQRLFEALARALLDQQPLLLLVDDLHWCDPDSLEWLHYLLRRDPGARLLLLAALRPDESVAVPGPETLWPDLRATGRLSTIELAPLDRHDTGELARRLSSETLDEAGLAQLYAETEGNPLFVLEMVRAGLVGAGTVPPTIRAVLAARLAQLSTEARDLAAIAATVGRAFRVEVLQRASGQSEDAVVRGLDELWRRRIVREQDADSYDFSHDKLREAAYAQLSTLRRRQAHRRVAEALEDVYAGDLDAVSARLAAHLEQAGLAALAAPYHVRAGDVARRVYATEAAEVHYRRALELLPDQEQSAVVLKLGEMWRWAGRLEEADALLRRGERLARDRGDELAAARCRCDRGNVLRRRGLYAEALDACEGALATFVAHGERAGECQVLTFMGVVHVEQGASARALECFDPAAALAGALGDRLKLARLLGCIGVVYFYQGRYAQALDYCERDLATARTLDDPVEMAFARVEMADAMGNIGLIYLELGDYPRALDWMSRALDEAIRCGHAMRWATTLVNLAQLYREQGALEGALSLAEQGALRAAESGFWLGAATGLAHAGYTLALQGRLDEAERQLTRAVAMLERMNHRVQLREALDYQAKLLLRRGDLDGALVRAEQSRRVATAIGRDDLAFDATLLAARLRLARSEYETATAIGELERMLPAWPRQEQQAALRYELWRLERGREADRRAAAELYRAAHARTPLLEYRERYHALTGERLSDPPPLPPVAAHIARQPGDIDALLERMGCVIAERGAAETL